MAEKISIVVPAYNVEKYIERTVQSICNQTYENLEIILVNDGSKDQTPEILEKLATKDARIKVLHQKNGGVTRARLNGVKASSGEWIGFIDGDDYIEPHMYEMLIGNAIKYKADISHCGYQMVFPSRIDMYYGTGTLIEQDNKKSVKDLLQGKIVEPGLCNKLFNRKVFDGLLNGSKMDFSIKNNEDLLMNYYLFSEAQKSVFIDECPYHYQVRKGSAATSKLNENKLRDPLKVLRILENETKEDEELCLIVRRRIVSQLINLSTLVSKKQKTLIKPYRKAARKELRQMLPNILRQDYSKKQKVMAVWSSLWPASYGWVHSVYARVSGIDKKYEVS